MRPYSLHRIMYGCRGLRLSHGSKQHMMARSGLEPRTSRTPCEHCDHWATNLLGTITVKNVRARTPQGKLTNFKTGDRFVEIVVPPEPLPKKKSVGIFIASLYHKEQKQKIEEIEWGNCWGKGDTGKKMRKRPRLLWLSQVRSQKRKHDLYRFSCC